jgi:membrane protein required for colicin V production
MTFAFIDLVFALVVLFFAINAAIKGLVHEIFTKAAFILGLFCALAFKSVLVPALQSRVQNALVAQILSFVVIFIVVYIFLRLIQQIVAKLFENDIMSGLNKALGFFFGIAEGLAVVGFALFLLHAEPWFDVAGLLEGSLFDGLYRLFTGADGVFGGGSANGGLIGV